MVTAQLLETPGTRALQTCLPNLHCFEDGALRVVENTGSAVMHKSCCGADASLARHLAAMTEMVKWRRGALVDNPKELLTLTDDLVKASLGQGE